MSGWSTNDIPPQAGKTAVVTGATGGLGFECASALAAGGAKVIVAARSESAGREALTAIWARHPHAPICFEPLDVSSLRSVAAFAERLAAREQSIDLLINNAGVMAIPERQTTIDGFEMQLGTNYLGHFALTLRLLPKLLRSPRARVVSLSSIVHWNGRIYLEDLHLEHAYGGWRAYCQSKLAVLMFALELQRRSDARGLSLLSAAAHPGFAGTNLHTSGLRTSKTGRATLFARLLDATSPMLAQSAADGALPILFAATSAEAAGGGLYGPNGLLGLGGPPVRARIAPQAHDKTMSSRLWAVSEKLTGMSF